MPHDRVLNSTCGYDHWPVQESCEAVESLWQACGSCAGFCISHGNKFFSEGIEEVDNDILPCMAASASEDISPRVIPSYVVLFWFALQVGDLTTKPHCAPRIQHCPSPCSFPIDYTLLSFSLLLSRLIYPLILCSPMQTKLPIEE